MAATSKKPVWKMVREAVKALGGKTANVAVREWILEHYPGTNRNTIQCQIIVCTVNHDSRIHYPENKKPRVSNIQYDFLFRTARGQVELYDPVRHGSWEIYARDDGRLGVREVGTDPDTKIEASSEFAAEAHLRDYLAQNLDKIERGLQLYVDEESEKTGVEYDTPIGRIDILARDTDGGWVVVELKVSRGPDSVAGQVLRYKNWVKKNLAGNSPVRGIIISRNVSEKVLYAIASDPDVSAMEYEIGLRLNNVPSL